MTPGSYQLPFSPSFLQLLLLTPTTGARAGQCSQERVALQVGDRVGKHAGIYCSVLVPKQCSQREGQLHGVWLREPETYSGAACNHADSHALTQDMVPLKGTGLCPGFPCIQGTGTIVVNASAEFELNYES